MSIYYKYVSRSDCLQQLQNFITAEILLRNCHTFKKQISKTFLFGVVQFYGSEVFNLEQD
jgi:hypothetical protein